MGVSRGIAVVVTCLAAAWGGIAPSAAANPYPAPTNLRSTGASTTSLSFDWSDVAGAPLYQVKVSKNSDMSSAQYSWYSASDGTVTGLTANTTYYVAVKVVAADHATLSDYSSRITAKTASQPPTSFSAPTNVALTSATATSLALDWSDVTGAPLYQVKISKNSDMSSAQYSWYPTSNGTVTGLAASTTYYVMVKVVSSSHETLGPYSTKISARTTASTPAGGADLHVGTFNISGANNDDKASGDQKIWSTRKPVVVQQVIGEQIDVLGTQEAYWGTGYSTSGTDQFTDLRNGLNAAGEPFEVTNTNRSVGKGTRILYNTDTVEKLTSGEFKYVNQVSGKTDRYLAWATFKHKASGKSFFFADTHLSPDSSTVKEKEWQELITKVKALNTASLPVVVTGDFNTSKFSAAAQTMLPAMKSAGFGDVMNQEFEVNPPRSPRAETVVNGWINSFNDWRRFVGDYAYEDRKDKVGNGIDWVFATNALRVKLWKVVIDFNPSTLMINGTIPSDHNMLSSVVVLP